MLETLVVAAGLMGPMPAAAPDPGGLERLVRQDCGACHGMTLKGGLGPPLTASALSGRDAAAVAAVILDGVAGTPMPPWRGLVSEADAAWIAEYLLHGDGQ